MKQKRYAVIAILFIAIISIYSKCGKDKETVKATPSDPYYIKIEGGKEWSSRWIVGQNFKYIDSSSFLSIFCAKNTTENAAYGDEVYISGVNGPGEYPVNILDVTEDESLDKMTFASFVTKGNIFYISYDGSFTVTTISENSVTAKFSLKCGKYNENFELLDEGTYIITGNINNLALRRPSITITGTSSFPVLPYTIDAHIDNSSNSLGITGTDIDEIKYINVIVKNYAQKSYTLNYSNDDIKNSNFNNGTAFVGYAVSPYYIGKTGNITINKIDEDLLGRTHVSGSFAAQCINLNKLKSSNIEESIDINGSFSDVMINESGENSNTICSKIISEKTMKQLKTTLNLNMIKK